MRYMIIVKATKESEAGARPTEQLFAEMARYHEELQRRGMLIDGSGLQPSAKGWRVRLNGDTRTVVDGPFAETKELIAGYTIIQAQSKAEALEITQRFPNPTNDGSQCEIEVRPLYELEDFGESPAIERFRAIGIGGKS